ncbi:hypothetical protein DV36_32375 [Amycolatopsis mediterranei]|nr:hypothetical protein DV36_32375 [Amycolatopsis mediterranei]
MRAIASVPSSASRSTAARTAKNVLSVRCTCPRPASGPSGASSHSSTARCLARSRWFALYSSAGEPMRARISRMQAAASAGVRSTPAWAKTSVSPPRRFSPSEPDSSQAISTGRTGPMMPERPGRGDRFTDRGAPPSSPLWTIGAPTATQAYA